MHSDEWLALSIQSGDREALAELVQRHQHALIGYLYRMTGGDRSLAEDLVQESFLRVLRGIAGYAYPRPFKPWLYAVATNLTRDYYKRAESRRAVPLEEDAPLQTCDHTEESLIETDQNRQIMRLLRALPDHQREVLILRYQQGLSHEAIAAVLDIPVGTVKSRLSLSLSHLRRALAEEDAHEIPDQR